MKKNICKLLMIISMLIVFSQEIQARSFLGKISSVVIIFSVLAGVGVWIFAARKRKELDE